MRRHISIEGNVREVVPSLVTEVGVGHRTEDPLNAGHYCGSGSLAVSP